MLDGTMTITLSEKAPIDWVRSKVGLGDFASETEAIAGGIARLREDDDETERWMREVVKPRLQRHEASPQPLIPLEDVMRCLEERRKSRELANQ